jgi:predicted alpha/beta hydrolase family esterase
MTGIIILPGIGGSGAEHWQTRWEAEGSAFSRFAPASWDEPQLGDWIEALDAAVSKAASPPVLVGHSLACLLVAHWQMRSALPVAGAMLVAVPDPDGAAFPMQAASFADPPTARFRFPSILIASGNDPYATPDYSRLRAGQWGSRLLEVGNVGHINAGSGVGDWPEGRAMLSDFMAKLQTA